MVGPATPKMPGTWTSSSSEEGDAFNVPRGVSQPGQWAAKTTPEVHIALPRHADSPLLDLDSDPVSSRPLPPLANSGARGGTVYGPARGAGQQAGAAGMPGTAGEPSTAGAVARQLPVSLDSDDSLLLGPLDSAPRPVTRPLPFGEIMVPATSENSSPEHRRGVKRTRNEFSEVEDSDLLQAGLGVEPRPSTANRSSQSRDQRSAPNSMQKSDSETDTEAPVVRRRIAGKRPARPDPFGASSTDEEAVVRRRPVSRTEETFPPAAGPPQDCRISDDEDLALAISQRRRRRLNPDSSPPSSDLLSPQTLLIRPPMPRRGVDGGSSRQRRAAEVDFNDSESRRRAPRAGRANASNLDYRVGRSVVDLTTPKPLERVELISDDEVEIVDAGPTSRPQRRNGTVRPSTRRKRKHSVVVLSDDSEPESNAGSLASAARSTRGSSLAPAEDADLVNGLGWGGEYLPYTRADRPLELPQVPSTNVGSPARRGNQQVLSSAFAPAGATLDDFMDVDIPGPGRRSYNDEPPVPQMMDPASSDVRRLNRLRRERIRPPGGSANSVVVLSDNEEIDLDADLDYIRDTLGRTRNLQGHAARRPPRPNNMSIGTWRAPSPPLFRSGPAGLHGAPAPMATNETEDERLARQLQQEEWGATGAVRPGGRAGPAPRPYVDDDDYHPPGDVFGELMRASSNIRSNRGPATRRRTGQAPRSGLSNFMDFFSSAAHSMGGGFFNRSRNGIAGSRNGIAGNPGDYLPDGALASYESLLELSERIGSAVPKTLDAKAVRALPKRPRRDDEKQCSVCLDDYAANLKQLTYLPECDHAFHHDCIGTWLKRGNASCPVCRRSVKDPNGGGESGGGAIRSPPSRNRGSRSNASRSDLQHGDGEEDFLEEQGLFGRPGARAAGTNRRAPAASRRRAENSSMVDQPFPPANVPSGRAAAPNRPRLDPAIDEVLRELEAEERMEHGRTLGQPPGGFPPRTSGRNGSRAAGGSANRRIRPAN